ncbi:MAG: hypothetical protein H6548_00945 [Chitinophagales bacterium]|nr:hypothetical protein [Chitinophagales bacterium]MCB9020663.1 hypothetical protein [Chitinophagales bacterium]MCB9031418.1 hypothetical protein [Chitinophagales bacterium]HPE96696.1 hypothetical protein [Chitinophagales bacterium]HPR28235.1 hypothetical protein [Chitinophagales bacterium]
MAILLTILMSLGLVSNSNVTINNTAVNQKDHQHMGGQYNSGNWEWDNTH